MRNLTYILFVIFFILPIIACANASDDLNLVCNGSAETTFLGKDGNYHSMGKVKTTKTFIFKNKKFQYILYPNINCEWTESRIFCRKWGIDNGENSNSYINVDLTVDRLSGIVSYDVSNMKKKDLNVLFGEYFDGKCEVAKAKF
jgi:hypothetical protein